MVDTQIGPPLRAAAALRLSIAPALRHAGWFGFFLILAPVIGPRGYGLFMLALGGVAIAEALLAETAAQALAKLAVVEERHWSTMLVTMTAAGAAVSLTLYMGAGAVGALVGEDAFSDIFRSLAMLPLLGALAVVPSVALRREGRPGALAAANAAGLAAGGGIAVSLAWAGAGPWSLVAQIVVQRLVECTVLWGIPGERIGLAWSGRHFAELADALDWRAFAAIWPVVTSYGPCLLVGLTLGPTATGLIMLASRLAEAPIDLFLTAGARSSPRQIMQRACQVVLPAVLASGLLAIALPAILDLRWWGAVLPAQILLLGAVPAAIIFVRASGAEHGAGEWRWQAVQALGGLAVIALVVPLGLVVIAAASIGWAAAIALASLWPIRRQLGAGWRVALGETARPCGGAAAAGFLMFVLADPVGLMLAPVPALCLLTASGWLLYLIIRGEPIGAVRPMARFPTDIVATFDAGD